MNDALFITDTSAHVWELLDSTSPNLADGASWTPVSAEAAAILDEEFSRQRNLAVMRETNSGGYFEVVLLPGSLWASLDNFVPSECNG